MGSDIRDEREGGTMNQTLAHERPGATFGVGSLPHRSMSEALDFVWNSTDIVTIPSLPRLSPAEGMIAQALVGIEGVSVGQYGGISVDVAHLDVDQFITTDVQSDAYGTFKEFLDTFTKRDVGKISSVKWQFVGPVTLGAALIRLGLEPGIAFPLALQAVRSHVLALEEEVTRVCGDITQIIVLDEPSLAEALEPGYPVGIEFIIDLISGALAAVEPRNISGVHCCARTDWGAILATGANIISVPVPNASNQEEMAEMLVAASRISDHLAHGGHIAWGAVRTDGPISVNPERSWKALMESMCALVQAGVNADLLRRRSYITPACGLSTHADGVAERVFTLVQKLSAKVADESTVSRLTMS
jgi:methionine synthase II (cobalamin-independent)